jgi:hypothetical protein
MLSREGLDENRRGADSIGLHRNRLQPRVIRVSRIKAEPLTRVWSGQVRSGWVGSGRVRSGLALSLNPGQVRWVRQLE